jgi:LysM repeat protein
MIDSYSRKLRKMRSTLLVGILVVLCITSCQRMESSTPTISTAGFTLTPYLPGVPGSTSLTLTPTPQPNSPIPAPSPTPLIYIIAEGDTLSGIAERFGLSIDSILVANPDIDAHSLLIGMQVMIPSSTDGTLPLPESILTGVHLDSPNCYPVADEGLWCLASVGNARGEPVEGLSAEITLLSQTGKVLTNRTAYSPLERLMPGKAMPLMAYFPPPIHTPWVASAVLKTVLPGKLEDNRYIPTSLDIQDMTLSPNNEWVSIQGIISLAGGGSPAGLVWLMAVAYNDEGQAIGMRKWEAEKALKEGKKISFDIELYSLGPKIANVDVQAEARP